MNNFLSFNYYFTSDYDFQYTKITLALAGILIFAGLGLSIYRKKYLKDKIAKKVIRPYAGKLYLYGFLLLTLLAFRELHISFLSMRIWWFLLLAFFIYTFLIFAFVYREEYRKRKARMKKNKGKDKYLPKKK